MSGAESRSEAPTPRRRAEARRRGQVPKSGEVAAAVGVLAAFFLLQWGASHMLERLQANMRQTYQHLPAEDLTAAEVGRLAGDAVVTVAQVVGPLAVGILVCGAAASLVQTGFLFSAHVLKPDWQRLNPWQGLKRMFSLRAWFDLAKTSVKVIVCALALYQVFVDRQTEMLMLGGLRPAVALGVVADIALDMGLRVGGLLVVAAVLDYAYQRFQYERNIRMSRQEVKEEMRNTEGDPQLKGRIRSLQRAWSQRRMMAAVPKADLLVTNPTHLAIALRYDPRTMGAPRVVAKGERLMAERIINLAKEHGVPIVRNVPLAHALYRATDVGKEIPASLYRAVAEVLAFVYRLRAGSRAVAAG